MLLLMRRVGVVIVRGWREGLGRGTKGDSGVLVIFIFLTFWIFTQMCSLCKNSLKYTRMIYTLSCIVLISSEEIEIVICKLISQENGFEGEVKERVIPKGKRQELTYKITKY